MDKNALLHEVYLFHLEKAYKQFKKYKTERFKQLGIDLTSDQWIVLKSISEVEGINQRELAGRCFKEPASVTRILDLLEKKGWVERRPVQDDRRTYEVHTTEAGKALVEKLLPLAVEIRAQGTQGLSEQEVEQLSQMLIQVYENFS